jgi:hypothetical protein
VKYRGRLCNLGCADLFKIKAGPKITAWTFKNHRAEPALTVFELIDKWTKVTIYIVMDAVPKYLLLCKPGRSKNVIR